MRLRVPATRQKKLPRSELASCFTRAAMFSGNKKLDDTMAVSYRRFLIFFAKIYFYMQEFTKIC